MKVTPIVAALMMVASCYEDCPDRPRKPPAPPPFVEPVDSPQPAPIETPPDAGPAWANPDLCVRYPSRHGTIVLYRHPQLIYSGQVITCEQPWFE